MQRRYLRHQIRRRRRPVGLVLGINIVTKTLALDIKHHRKIIRLLLLDQLAQHVDHPENSPGRLPLRISQPRHGMISPEQVVGTVYEGE